MPESPCYANNYEDERDSMCEFCGANVHVCGCVVEPDDADLCQHESTSVEETYPIDYQGRTRAVLVCEDCGENLGDVGPGSGVL
jgi:hypothetical protein